MQRMEHIGKNNGNNHATASRFTGDKLLERFRALWLEKFDGMIDLWKVEQWLQEMNIIFDAVECNDQDSCRIAIFQLTYAAAGWWESERATLGEEWVRRLTWTAFKVRFLESIFRWQKGITRERSLLNLSKEIGLFESILLNLNVCHDLRTIWLVT